MTWDILSLRAATAYLQSFHHFDFKFVGLDQGMATTWPWNWSPGLIQGAFCIMFRARPVGTGLGAQLGREMTEKQNLDYKSLFLDLIAAKVAPCEKKLVVYQWI